MMRIEGAGYQNYDVPGIVLIDEVEQHLHVELQKKALPILTDMFPNIQFIVTTHSPFVISSLENAVIYDLKNRERIEDASAYSYSILGETWFGVDEYSEPMNDKILRIQALLTKEVRSGTEDTELQSLIKYLAKLPSTVIGLELAVQIQNFKMQHRDLFSEVHL
jgi:predicted ATP-binding protein involved in virulence